MLSSIRNESMKDMSQDKGLFSRSIEAHANIETGYLGDMRHVESILRMAAKEVFDVLPEILDDPKQIEELIESVGRKRMRAFFGSTGNTPIQGFNKPGGVDEFVAKWTGVKDTKPTDRLVGGFATMLDELIDVEIDAQEEEFEENWHWRVDEIFQRYALIFMGISPAQQEHFQ